MDDFSDGIVSPVDSIKNTIIFVFSSHRGEDLYKWNSPVGTEENI